MKADFYSTKIQFNVLSEREDHEKAYDRLPDINLYFAMVDLVGSTNYRLAKGPKAGYLRGETFFSIVRNVVSPCTAVRTIKEIGDAVLVVSDEFRPLLETVILIDQVSYQIAALAGEEAYPFKVRSALNFGVVKRLKRLHEDYLGAAIDQLSRIMKADDRRTNTFIHESTYDHAKDIIGEYRDMVRVSDPIVLPHAVSKGSLRDIYYRELYMDHQAFNGFQSCFGPWAMSARQPQVVDEDAQSVQR